MGDRLEAVRRMHRARRLPGDAEKRKAPPKRGFFWRREPESNRPKRLCRPLHNRFAIAPKADCPDAVRQATDFYSRTGSPSNKKGSVASPLLGAGDETCTRTVSRCFPITFFVGLASEDLNCSLVFRPRQQIRPKSSTDVQRAALSTPDPRSVHRRRQLPRTHHPRPVVCPASITAKTIRQMVLVMAQLGCHLGTPAPQLTGDLLVKLL